jgi:AraC-like DNA-binding protein
MPDCRVPVGLPEALEAQGVSPREVLAAARLPPSVFDPGERVPVARYFALWQAIRSVSGRVEIGIALARSVQADLTEPLFLAVLSAADVRAALDIICAYKRQLSPEEVVLATDADARRFALAWRWPGVEVLAPQVLVEAEFAFVIEMCRRCTRQLDFRPLSVDLAFAALEPSAVRDAFFACSVRTGAARNCLWFEAEDLKQPFLTHNPRMLKALIPHLGASAPAPIRAPIARVREAIAGKLKGQRPRLQAIARLVAMSTRAMQRVLQENGTTFRQVLDDVRHQHAREYLSSTSFSDQEVSFLLGYDDPSSFYRAFRSWTGTSPSEFRRKRTSPA